MLTLPRSDFLVAQAALSGYSDLPMRRVARAHGAAFTFHEVVLDQDVLRRGKVRKRILSVAADDHPIGGQLMGSEPATFGHAARELVAAGYDVVDINFGCPVPRVLGRCRGGYLLGEPETALAIVDSVLQSVAGRVPVTVKMRRGLDDSLAAERAFFTILDGAFARGVRAVTVHGRTVAQRYAGWSRWELLARVKRHVGTQTVLGSGDLFSPFAVQRMKEETGVDGVTLARGCIGNPFLFAQCRALLAGGTPSFPSVAEQRCALWRHWQEALAHYGASRALAYARQHAVKYARLHPAPVCARDRLVRAKSPAAFEAAVAELYDDARHGAPARPLLPADEARLAGDALRACVGPRAVG